MELRDLLIVAAATWYVSYTVTRKDGPWDIFKRFREKFPIGGLTSCMPCFSVYVAAVLLLLWYSAFQPGVVCLGVAGSALMLGSYSGASHV